VYQQQEQEQQEQEQEQQDAENPFLDPPFSRIKTSAEKADERRAKDVVKASTTSSPPIGLLETLPCLYYSAAAQNAKLQTTPFRNI
jgi:hypothetical protein